MKKRPCSRSDAYFANYSHWTESDEELSASQSLPKLTSSKDLTHVARMAGCLHILLSVMDQVMSTPAPDDIQVPTDITMRTLDMAHSIFITVMKQKAIFVEVCANKFLFWKGYCKYVVTKRVYNWCMVWSDTRGLCTQATAWSICYISCGHVSPNQNRVSDVFIRNYPSCIIVLGAVVQPDYVPG